MPPTLSIMNEFTTLYGNIYAYNLDEIYRKAFHDQKWHPLKTIGLFEELETDLESELHMTDDPYTDWYIRDKLKMIARYIEVLETHML